MAQHIPIGSFRTKIFRKIKESIQRDFQNINRVGIGPKWCRIRLTIAKLTEYLQASFTG